MLKAGENPVVKERGQNTMNHTSMEIMVHTEAIMGLHVMIHRK